MHNFMKSKVENLQADGTLPCEGYTLEYWEQQFSHILKITFKNKIYFLKQIKPRINHHNDELLNKLIVEYEALTKYEPYFRNNDNCNIPKVIYFSHKELLLVTEKLDGISLGGVFRQYVGRLTKGAWETETVFSRVGAFYSAFHSFEIQLYQLGHLEALIAYIEERLISIVFTDEEKSQISFYLESVFKILKSDLSNYTLVPVHHDPNFSNILYDDSSINVLDFGDFAFDSPYQDIACFKLMIDGQFVSSVKYSHRAKKKLLNAFCEGYKIEIRVTGEGSIIPAVSSQKFIYFF